MAQVAMVMNLDKCIGCHTCSVTCKQVWTNRPGTEYVYFNNVETKPGVGYPKRYEDQEQWHGGWALDRKGRLQLKAGGRVKKLATLFWNPHLPAIDDYGDPWTYDYQTLIDAPPTGRPAWCRPSPSCRTTCPWSLTSPRRTRAARSCCGRTGPTWNCCCAPCATRGRRTRTRSAPSARSCRRCAGRS
jgi:nitrate reductase beta subunit